MYNVLFISIPLSANRRVSFIQTARFASERCEHGQRWAKNAEKVALGKPWKMVGEKNQMIPLESTRTKRTNL